MLCYVCFISLSLKDNLTAFCSPENLLHGYYLSVDCRRRRKRRM